MLASSVGLNGCVAQFGFERFEAEADRDDAFLDAGRAPAGERAGALEFAAGRRLNVKPDGRRRPGFR